MKDYAVYIFDWDGTLADTLQVWLDTMQRNLEKLNIELPTEALIAGLGDWGDMIPLGFPAEKLQEFADATREEAKRELSKAPLYAGARETVELLKSKGKKVALVSASHKNTLPAVLAIHGLQNDFDVIVYGSEVERHKPDPESVLLALERLGNPDKNSVIMLGDSHRDMGAARNAGIDRILYHPPSHHIIHDSEHLQSFEPVVTIESWEEFQEVLQ
jgi:HAD superfamily hydrolase (TIGR01509 family)